MSLLASLPPPTKTYVASEPELPTSSGARHAPGVIREVPPYGRRQGFVPRRVEDFGDGGAFPEVHVLQYPLEMGRPNQRGGAGGGGIAGGRGSGTVVALSVNADGEVNYDAVIRQGKAAQKWVASSHGALVPKLEQLNSEMPLPDEESVEESARDTAAALEAVLSRKQAAVNPKTLPAQPGAAQYIKYTPANSNAAHASGAATRIIKMQDAPVDPLEPPKFRHVKVPRGAGSPPVPVMHSPPRALTAKDQADWRIPPCISNWKNSKGYTIPLDKRLAADGRGLQEVQVNDQFAKFAEALYVAEHKARSAVDARARMQRELAAREKESKESELRELAQRARQDRLGGGFGGGRDDASGLHGAADSAGGLAARDVGVAAPPSPPSSDSERELPHAHRTRDDEDYDRRGHGDRYEHDGDRRRESFPTGARRDGDDRGETRREREERRARDEIREERRRERERERRLEARDAHGHKRSKLTRDRDRDISERVALGQARVSNAGEAMYDQRLFNQDTGVGAGHGPDDAYNLYDKPLFADRSEVFKARGGRHVDDDAGDGDRAGPSDATTRRFKPDKGFSGADYTGASQNEGPVQFESEAAGADPFGLDAFLSDVRGGRKKGGPLDDRTGRGGSMAAAAGGSGGTSGEMSNRRMDFVSSSSEPRRR